MNENNLNNCRQLLPYYSIISNSFRLYNFLYFLFIDMKSSTCFIIVRVNQCREVSNNKHQSDIQLEKNTNDR